MKWELYFPRFFERLRRHAYGTLILGYLATLAVFSWYAGDIWSPTIIFLLVAMALLGILGAAKPWTRPWVALATIGLSFQVISGPIDALGNAGGAFSFLDLDKYVWGSSLTIWAQNAFSSAVTTEATSLVYAALLPFVLGTSFAIWWFRRGSFAWFVTAMVLTSYAALLTFVLMPTAPPWFSGAANDLFHASGVEAVAGLLAPLSTLFVPDYFAAFPSLHAAYTITCCYFLFKVDFRLGLIGGLMAGATLFSTLYLGQHYAIDLIGGAAYSLIPCWVAERFGRIGRHDAAVLRD